MTTRRRHPERPARLRRRMAIVVLATAGGLAPLAQVPSSGATPSTSGPCAGAAGVTVVVDATRLGGGVRTGCAPGSPRDGLEALRSAGFAVRGTARFPGFVCRIDDAPASDPCLDSAPADAYWAYWQGTSGTGWTYSDTGAAERRPTPGTVEGWVFSDTTGAPPSVAPPARAAAVAAAPSAPAPPPPSASAPGAGPAAQVAGRTTVVPAADPGAPPATPATPPAAPDPVPAPAVDPAAPDDAAVPTSGPTVPGGAASPGERGTTATDRESSLRSAPTPEPAGATGGGNPWPALVGVVLVVAVGATGAVVARRRRVGSNSPW